MRTRVSPILVALATSTPAAAEPAITATGYLEAYYQLQLQDAENRITNLRGFDNRSRTFTLSNAAIGATGEEGPVTARLVLQVGHTGSTYYLAEPVSPGTASASASSGELWKYVQVAMLSWKAPAALTVEAGIVPSPIGIEVIPIKDNWNWSRSNLFFGLPFYHTGVRVMRPLGAGWTGVLHVYNGWNSVVDNNGYPSVAASAAYAAERVTAQVLYFGGVERATGAPEGTPWRHLVDVLGQLAITDRVSIAGQLDAGVEPNDVGTSWWLAAAAYGKLAITDELYGAIRGDYFYEETDSAAAIFWPVRWVASGAATLSYQPAAGVSVRAEYRHDHAADAAFFGGAVAGDGVMTPYVPDRDRQDTVTLGATAWF